LRRHELLDTLIHPLAEDKILAIACYVVLMEVRVHLQGRLE